MPSSSIGSSHPNGFTENDGPSKLYQIIVRQFPNVPIISLPRKYFNDEIGKSFINNYGLQEDTAGLLFGLSTKYISRINNNK